MKMSKRIALGGIFSALSLVVMFISGVFPFAEYTCPALAGICLMPLVIEINKKTAFIAYIAVSVLSLFVTPNKEPVILFIAILGYYPILKSLLEKLKNRVFEWILKLAIFNVAVILSYIVLINFMGMTELLADFNSIFKYGIVVFWILANVVFVIYDYALSGLAYMYVQKLQPKIRKL